MKKRKINEELESFIYQKSCHTCIEEFGDNNNNNNNDNRNKYNVRDNYHYTGKYRGAAHSICNLK